ncbi:MAG: pentapeptide repeat-containing protein, partial [Cyanobacteria bacterium J06555_13]
MEKENFTEYQGKVLENRCFDRQNLSGANFSKAQLQGATFRDCILTNANFSKADIRGCNFSKATLVSANFEFSQMGFSPKCFTQFIFLTPFRLGGPPEDSSIISKRTNLVAPFSDTVIAGPLTDTELATSITMSFAFSLVWIGFLLFSLNQTRMSQIEVAIMPYTIVGIASLSALVLSIREALKLARRVASTSFCNADLSGASFKNTAIENTDFSEAIQSESPS